MVFSSLRLYHPPGWEKFIKTTYVYLNTELHALNFCTQLIVWFLLDFLAIHVIILPTSLLWYLAPSPFAKKPPSYFLPLTDQLYISITLCFPLIFFCITYSPAQRNPLFPHMSYHITCIQIFPFVFFPKLPILSLAICSYFYCFCSYYGPHTHIWIFGAMRENMQCLSFWVSINRISSSYIHLPAKFMASFVFTTE